MNRPGLKKVSVVVGAVLIILGIGWGVYVLSGDSGGEKVVLPLQFITARNNAAVVSKEIVDLANDTNRALKRAILLDSRDNYSQMLYLFDDARKTNKEAYTKAFTLSQELQSLAESLSGISNLRTQRLAYDAVGTELSLVSEFIAYTRSVNEFLDTLTYATPDEIQASTKKAEGLLFDISGGARKINELNATFLEKMGEFDKSIQ
ncbi:MAG: hypothetical protein Q7R98_01260 [Candidatus Jorgensenbacteria bacterium]|nr:hypothetical protein [Candidatus Jorgensenbacteria bacterium]